MFAVRSTSAMMSSKITINFVVNKHYQKGSIMPTPQGNVNSLLIDQYKSALSKCEEKLKEVSDEYHRLKAQVTTYKKNLESLEALETARKSGKFEEFNESELTPTRISQHDVKQLRRRIREHFQEMGEGKSETPKELTARLTEQGWPEKGLRIKVSNLLRKIAGDDNEIWLARLGHGKYQYCSNSQRYQALKSEK